MKHLLVAAVLLPGLLACSSEPVEDDADAGRKYESTYVDVSGQVKLHPLEVKWRAANNLEAPSLASLTVNVEDALKATSGQPALETTTSDADGRFEVAKVNVTNVSLALVASVQDPSGVLADCGYGLVRGQPKEDLVDMPVYVVSKDFLDYIALPTGLGADELLKLGFMFVQLSDAAHEKGIEGAKLALRVQSTNRLIEDSEDHPIWYLDETLSSVAAGDETSQSGVLIYVPEFGAKEYSAVKSGSQFEVKLAGARQNFVLSVFIVEE